jgi:S-adenosylmethionine:tRNA ribosyltransferase-isomerase
MLRGCLQPAIPNSTSACFDEPYRVSQAAADAINQAQFSGKRIIAVGTTVVRALEHSVQEGRIAPGENLATERIGVGTRLKVVDALLSGTHEAGTSHHGLLRAFLSDAELTRLMTELNMREYRTHEFGDSVLVSRTFNKLAEPYTVRQKRNRDISTISDWRAQ